MSLTYDEARDLIYEPFHRVWKQLGLEASYADVKGNPPSTESVWARVILRHDNAPQASLANHYGRRRFRNSGIVLIQIFAPLGDGSKAGYDAAQAVTDAYRRNRSPIWFRNARLNEVGNDGAYSVRNFVANFSYDQII